MHWFLQELFAYGAMKSRATMLCANMQNRIIHILLNEIYCSKEYYLDRSKVLVRKARALRASGVQNISSCLVCLSDAISLLVTHPLPSLLHPSCPISLCLPQGRSKIHFFSYWTRKVYWIHLKAMRLLSMNWLLRTACMHIVPRRPIMARR
jgi:hypothetical protein